jgi:hypothetical protein
MEVKGISGEEVGELGEGPALCPWGLGGHCVTCWCLPAQEAGKLLQPVC